MTINQLINRQSNWTKRADARDKHGYSVNIATVPYQKGPRLKHLQSFSLYGALIWCFSQDTHADKRQSETNKLRKAIRQYTGKDWSIAGFNDDPSTSYEDIEKVLKIYKNL